ncbi:MAG TPA: 50S ribosomal protein L11 methyltransferase [Verrucomicrobiae bacterium]|jgi:ribosomal protein L11 methyltransferase|nr:50S ribosomal protein L11 methyltransferase [Verrucomicrobiae bacterium]
MSTRGPIWKISINTTPEAEDAVTELLYNSLELPVSSYTDIETGEVTVATYLSWERRRPAGKLESLPKIPALPELRTGLQQIQACGLNIGLGKISVQKIRREDWAESWKRHFKPIEIGAALLIKPSWSKRPPKKGQAVIVLDPGLSFGTGQHPTTSFCLQQLATRSSLITRHAALSLLDIGSGSGILAIAAAKLGYAPVDAFDFDPEAVRIARENARKNRVLRKIHLTRGDVTKLTLRRNKQYDLICANLISTLLVAERARILGRLKTTGVLVLAGILKNEFASVQRVYESAGLRLIASRAEKEWRSGAFVYRRPA